MGKYVIFVIMGLFASIFTLRMQANRFITNSITNYVEKHNQFMARNIANSAALVALNALTIDVHETQGQNNSPLFGGVYSYYFERNNEDQSLGLTEIRVTSISKYLGHTDSVIVLLTRPSFSRYAYFTNHEGNIWFSSGDTIRGPCHTNTYFQMAYEPVFFGKVTSHRVFNAHSPYRKYTSGSTNPHFLGGTEWGVPKLTMPDEIPQELIDAAQNGGIFIHNSHAWIEFQSDGTVRIAAKNSASEPNQNQYTTYNLAGTNGAIYVHNHSTRPTVRVEGTVNGQATLATRGSIQITSDIFLADNPLVNPNSNDMLGLVAAQDIIVYNNQQDQDRTIQATIMTMNPAVANNKNFWVDRYSNQRYGTLHLLGGLIQNSRGAVGTVGNQ
ncbi:MAG: DUF4900 domain-containing protein, partial [bacterium]|nr:DUF4900 domain-containing protein [bacterium]